MGDNAPERSSGQSEGPIVQVRICEAANGRQNWGSTLVRNSACFKLLEEGGGRSRKEQGGSFLPILASRAEAWRDTD